MSDCVKFDQKVCEMLADKAGNNRYLSDEKLEVLIESVKCAKLKELKKDPKDYWLLQHYDVISTGGVERLIAPVDESNKVLYYVPLSKLYQVIHEAHLSVGHGGRIRTRNEIFKRYKNITSEAITTFISLCEVCEKKRATKRKGLVAKPIISKDFNCRCQVCLIDFQAQAVGDYRFVMVCQDHLTKFVNLKPLKTKTAAEVAQNLIWIFNTFGAPYILQSDNGREFSNKIIEEVVKQWPDLIIVHGKPRHSQSQGSVERANQDIEKMLSEWLQDHPGRTWVEGLSYVQMMKNTAYHRGIKCSPYEALFGAPPKIGLKSSCLPNDVIRALRTEEELQCLATSDSADAQPQSEDENCNISTICDEFSNTVTIEHSNDKKELRFEEVTIQKPQIADHTEGSFKDDRSDEDQSEPFNEKERSKRKTRIIKKRKEALLNLEEQPKKMKMSSNLKFPAGVVGQTVRIQVPDVDRARADARNVLGVILNIENETYEIGTKFGTLNQKYVRNQFEISKDSFVQLEDVPANTISLRECARRESLCGGQGYKRCNCKKNCSTNKCSCRSRGNQCHSKCHNSSSCDNK